MGRLHSAIRQMEGLAYNVEKWNKFMKEKQKTMDEDEGVVEEKDQAELQNWRKKYRGRKQRRKNWRKRYRERTKNRVFIFR